MKPLHVAFLWHMHQPYYKDNAKNSYLMPWVRLHAIKGYFDMVDMLDDFPEVKVTFNLVPSLILQLKDYCLPETMDPFLEHTLIPARNLTLEQRQFILLNFFMANWDHMIKPYPRYWELLHKRGFKIRSTEMPEIATSFSVQEFMDLQAWTNLSWFGYRAKKRFPEIEEFIKKERGYHESDIHKIIKIQRDVIQLVLPTYKKAHEEGRIEISTSPFYHPILPLVYDTQFAQRSMPHAPLPNKFNHPEDVESQIRNGIEFSEKTFGFKPKGLWPSEGSVSPELIPILSDLNIHWMATDEEILAHTIPVFDKGAALFKPYAALYHDKSVNIFFRDRGLSDLIGFTYSQNSPEASSKDFTDHLLEIHKYREDEGSIVSVILDGENAWEHYPDGGEGLLRGIYENLSSNSNLIPVTFSGYLNKYTPKEKLSNLHSGSWIHHDFDIWIGSEEENTAWDYLGKTRQFVSDLKNIPKDKMKLILEQIYIAEGSDWFWWYGDDFSTDNDAEFDRLFRLHLARCYELANHEVPEFLHQSVIRTKSEAFIEKPVGFINPVIDGKKTHFFEWHESGLYQSPPDSTMNRFERYVHQIYFGFNLSTFFVRVDPYRLEHIQQIKNMQMNIYLTKPYDYKILLPHLFQAGGEKEFSLLSSSNGVEYKEVRSYSTAAFENVIELAIPFSDLGLKGGDEVRFKVAILKGDIVQEMHPGFGYLNFTVPTENFETEMWSV